MAGDLLGDHWPLEESLPVLMKVAKEGKYVPGREAAVDGLQPSKCDLGKSVGNQHAKQPKGVEKIPDDVTDSKQATQEAICFSNKGVIE